MKKVFIEKDCTIYHKEKSFTANGAFVGETLIIAYVGESLKDGMDCDRVFGSQNLLVDWHGNKIGTCTLGKGWPIRSVFSSRMYQIYALVNGKEYTGRGMGEGMSCRLRPVA